MNFTQLNDVTHLLKISRNDLASAAGVTVQQIGLLCNAKSSPSFSVAQKIEAFVSRIYNDVRPLTPETLDQFVWSTLFPYAPYPSNNTTPRTPRQTKSKTNPNEKDSPCPKTQSSDTNSNPNSLSQNTSSGGLLQANVNSTETQNSSPKESEVTGQDANLHASADRAGPPVSLPVLNCDFSIAASAAKVFPAIFAQGRAATDAFITECYKHPWTFSKHAKPERPESRRARVVRLLTRLAGGVSLRVRSCDPDVTQRKNRLFANICAFIAYERKKNTQSKGAYDLHTFGHRNATLDMMLKNEKFSEMITDPRTGEKATREQCEAVLRENNWLVDSRNDVLDFIAETIGTRPRYRGDEIMADWSGLPVKVDTAAFEVVNKRTGKKEKRFKKFGFHVAVDVSTNYTWVDLTYGDNEYATWFGFLRNLFFRDLGYAPGWLIMDKVSGVLPSLQNINPDDGFANVNPILIAIAGGGTRFNMHTPAHAQAKGNVEVAGKLFKHRSFHGASVRKMLQQHMNGVLRSPRHVICHAEVNQLFEEARADVNQHILCRDGIELYKRCDGWNEDNEDKAIRNNDRYVSNAEAIIEDIAARTKVVVCNGNLVDLRINGVRYYAELSGFEEQGIAKPKGAKALIIPNGIKASDDPDGYRVCLVEDAEKGGLPRFASLTAKVCQKDKEGFDIIRPFRGQGYHAKPTTQADEVRREKAQGVRDWAKIVTGKVNAKQGTTDDEYQCE